MPIRFYAGGAPSWWPFHVSTPSSLSSLPRGVSSVLLDNGMWGFWKAGRRPPLDVWLARLAAAALEASRRADEVYVVLPDWLGDPGFTLAAAGHPVARRLCRDYTCVAVAHASGGLQGHYRAGLELASLGHIGCLAAPLKLNCRRVRRPSLDCQRAVLGQVAEAAREAGLGCVHGLGAVMEPGHLARLASMGMTSFDSAAWVRPKPAYLEAYASGCRGSLKDCFMVATLRRLLAGGVELEGAGRALEAWALRGG